MSKSKLYVFGIGGTGSRVLRALTMLLASGVDCGGMTVVPIIIDPDQSAADLTRTVELLKRYTRVREKLDFGDTTKSTKTRFFYTNISELDEGFRLPLNADTSNKPFEKYIGLSSMTRKNKALIKMLFSEKNLESDMIVGFKGNPNIGSVVLNQFQDSKQFEVFANSFNPDDKIFIISSIFGGTGASGFPLLLKTLRSGDEKLVKKNAGAIKDAVIGAVSVLPYFRVGPSEKSEIDSTTFKSKTRAALSYYKRNISDINDIDYLYYVADNADTEPYKNHEGGSTQQNDAHRVELWAALAIIDFAKKSKEKRGDEDVTQHKEFGTDKCSDPMVFSDLGTETKQQIFEPLSQMALFARFMKDGKEGGHYKESCESQPWAKNHGLRSDFMQTDFVESLRFVQLDEKSGFIRWLEEMAGNQRSFSPFDLDSADPIKIVRGGEVKYGFLSKKGYDFFDDKLNTESKQKVNANLSKEQKLIEFFYAATSSILSEKYKKE